MNQDEIITAGIKYVENALLDAGVPSLSMIRKPGYPLVFRIEIDGNIERFAITVDHLERIKK